MTLNPTPPLNPRSKALVDFLSGKGTRKYRNTVVVVDGITFASIREGHRYSALKLLERAGDISDLETHPKFELHVSGVKIGTYSADFRYRRGDQVVVEDVKSKATETQLFRWKARHMLAEHGVTVEIVR